MVNKTGIIIAWHGSVHILDGPLRLPEEGKPERAIFLTDNSDEAEELASGVYEVRVDITDFGEVDYADVADPNGLYSDEHRRLYEPDVMALILASAQGRPGVIIRDIQNFEGGRITTTYAVLDPSVILSHRPMPSEDFEENDANEDSSSFGPRA